MDTQINKQVWFITGASSGIGLDLAKTLVEKGYCVAGTSRKLANIQDKIQSPLFLALQMDVVSEANVAEGLKKVVEKFGRVDVIVNNAGQAMFGSVEEVSDKEMREMFDSNYFGPMNVIRQALKYLRPQKSGVIFNVSSIAGYSGMENWGSYVATKFALSGVSESLAKECKLFGVQVCSVSPGFVRTPIHNVMNFVQEEIPEYKSRETVTGLYKYLDTQPFSDSIKMAHLLIQVAQENDIPIYLFCGKDANYYAKAKIATVSEIILKNEKRSGEDILEDSKPNGH
ncbi:short-chain dehydrogenase/reductase (SDR) family protein [Tieghemostelium lacteum]|uniref:Short-chain dehydrogenase/reductase (SDR) family protein n=1 Tax=Tieghemostelium lacteum TaxID=361077 RepID=A0A151ZEF3_TIELA|nr:short-chain dehydrogenase/reductase (SDR) family protein [Tieghemostelium lacteum]|eukprot:KYQ92290.1 short-chain dehydrogenase/reductase (SDR) family protein [Tieghemostelium lacteum]